MSGTVDVLLCADREGARRFKLLCAHAPGLRVTNTARSGGEAVALFRQQKYDLVAIAGDLDGVGGVRVAGALHRERPTPTVLLASDHELSEIRSHLVSRGLGEATVITTQYVDEDASGAARALRAAANHRRAAPPGVSVLPVAAHDFRPRAEIEQIRAAACDVIVLLGSAGTPHMLPKWLPGAADRVAPIIVAVHHNPKLSESFCEWVSELFERPVARPEFDSPGFELGMVNVVPAVDDPLSERLLPDLSAVVERVLDADLVPLVCVASGMAFAGADALRRVVAAGGMVVVLNPGQCTAPTMPESVIASGLAQHVVSVREMGWVLRHGAMVNRRGLAVAG